MHIQAFVRAQARALGTQEICVPITLLLHIKELKGNCSYIVEHDV